MTWWSRPKRQQQQIIMTTILNRKENLHFTWKYINKDDKDSKLFAENIMGNVFEIILFLIKMHWTVSKMEFPCTQAHLNDDDTLICKVNEFKKENDH